MSLRETMPNVARLVDHRRRLYGQEYVDRAIKLAILGQHDLFYAFEGGRHLGTAFTSAVTGATLLERGVDGDIAYGLILAPPGTVQAPAIPIGSLLASHCSGLDDPENSLLSNGVGGT